MSAEVKGEAKAAPLMYEDVFLAIKARFPDQRAFRTMHDELRVVTNEELISDLQPSCIESMRVDSAKDNKKLSEARCWIRLFPIEVRLWLLRLFWLHHLQVDKSSLALQQAKVAAYEAAMAIIKLDAKGFAELLEQEAGQKQQHETPAASQGDAKRQETPKERDDIVTRNPLLDPPTSDDPMIDTVQLRDNLQPTPVKVRQLERHVTPDNWACEFLREMLRRHMSLIQGRLTKLHPEYSVIIQNDYGKQLDQLKRIPANILFEEIKWPPLAPRTAAALPVSEHTSTSELFRESAYAELLAILFSLNKDVRCVLQCVVDQARKDPCNVRLGLRHFTALLSSPPPLPKVAQV